MDVRLLYVDSVASAGALDELSDVRLVADKEISEAGTLPRGARGTVMAVHGIGEAYDVEFAEPFHALLLLKADEVEAIEGATRDRLLAETGDVRGRG